MKLENEFERCVCGCNGITTVRKDIPINERLYYIEGVGQLKPSCYEKIYSDKRKEELEAKLWLQEMGIILD